jgi:AraC-like DNA-binding protein
MHFTRWLQSLSPRNGVGKRRFFFRMLSFLLLFAGVPVLVVGVLSIRHSQTQIIRQVGASLRENLEEKAKLIDQRVRQIDALACQAFLLEEVSELVARRDLGSEYYYIIYRLQKRLDTFAVPGSWVLSAGVYSRDRGYMLSNMDSGTGQQLDDAVSILAAEEDRIFLGPRMVDGLPVISYVRRFPPYADDSDVVVVLNTDYRRFFDFADDSGRTDGAIVLVLDGDSNVVYTTDSSRFSLLDRLPAETIAAREGVVRLDRTRYFLTSRRLSQTSWALCFLFPHSLLVENAKLATNMILFSLLAVLGLALLGACLVSMRLYQPVVTLLGEVLGRSEATEHPDGDEYEIIESALRDLFSEHEELATKLKMTLPAFREHSIHDLLVNKEFDVKRLQDALEILGIRFIHTKYAVVLIDAENAPFDKSMEFYLDNALRPYQGKIAYSCARTRPSRGLMILNTDLDSADVHRIFLGVKRELNFHDIDLTICVSRFTEDQAEVKRCYYQVLHNMARKFYLGSNRILRSGGPPAQDEEFFYDAEVEAELMHQLQSQNREGALSTLKRLAEDVSRRTPSVDYVRYLYFQIAHNLVKKFWEIGIDPGELQPSPKCLFKRIHGCKMLSELEQLLRELITTAFDLIDHKRSTARDRLVDSVIDYIDRNFMRPISLAELSDLVLLSPRYLNRIFKTEMGMTIGNYITGKRMETAKDFLEHENMKIKEIGRIVGYGNVQSFIRSFKKQYGMTPLAFRRLSCAGSLAAGGPR